MGSDLGRCDSTLKEPSDELLHVCCFSTVQERRGCSIVKGSKLSVCRPNASLRLFGVSYTQ